MFEVNGNYANRKGNYTVVSIDGDKMLVRFEDGTESNLRMALQERIWVNIDAERQVEAAKLANQPKAAPNSNFFIKTVTISEEGDLIETGLRARHAVALAETKIDRGDRFIYYAVEPELFIAVATVTAAPKKGKAKDYFFGDVPKAKVLVYPLDIDALIENAGAAIHVDTMELESLANHREVLKAPFQHLTINEDDFELLAELIMEVGESDEAVVDDSEIEPEQELIMESMDD